MFKYSKLIFSFIISFYFLYRIKLFSEWSFLDGIDLIFHEAGHTILFFTGDLIQAMGGSIVQILIPLIVAVYFFLKSQFASSSIILMWVGQSFLNVSVYVKDSIDMSLPLLGGDGVGHDWNFILTKLGVLEYTNIAFLVFFTIGVIFILLGVVGSLYFSYLETKIPRATL